MHDSVREFIAREAPHLIPSVLEVGSLNVNGSIRELLPDQSSAWGIDIVDGPGVDQVYDGVTIPLPMQTPFKDEDGPRLGRWGGVVCCEVFEHVADPIYMAAEIVRVVEPGGIILVTARAPGFGYHNPPDRWRFMPGALSEMFDRLGCRSMEWPDPGPPGWFVRAVRP